MSLALVWIACTKGDAPVDTGSGSSTIPKGPGWPPKNLLMISIDTTRRDYIDRYATDGAVRAPFLSKLLGEGVAFDDHQQCSNWTYGSTTCTLEGKLNEETGWLARLGVARTPVPDGRRTLAARLSEQGFHTVLISSNAWLSPEWNNAQGYSVIRRPATDNSFELLSQGLSELKTAYALSHERWMLHVHLIQAHPAYTPADPYDDPVEALPPIPWNLDEQLVQYEAAFEWPQMTEEEQTLLETHLKTRYSGELLQQDDELAAWWKQANREGFLDDTLVVFWTDHGEQFFEHGYQAHAYLMGAEENDAVMGMWAKQLEPMAFSGPTHAVDLLPTVLDTLGVPPDPGEVFSGYVAGTAPEDRARFASSTSRLGPVVSVTKGDFKLQYRADGSLQLWNRSDDRAELIDLYTPEHPAGQELWALLQPHVVQVANLAPDSPIVWPEEP